MSWNGVAAHSRRWLVWPRIDKTGETKSMDSLDTTALWVHEKNKEMNILCCRSLLSKRMSKSGSRDKFKTKFFAYCLK